jgi:hypothetical protein
MWNFRYSHGKKYHKKHAKCLDTKDNVSEGQEEEIP